MKYLILAATVALTVSLTGCEKPFADALGGNALSASVQNRAEVKIATQLIDFVNGAQAPSDMRKFTAIGDANGHDEGWLFINQYENYTSHIKNWEDDEEEEEPEEHELILQVSKTLSDGTQAVYKEEKGDFPALTWEGNGYFYDTSIKNPNHNNLQVLTELAEARKVQQIINKKTEIMHLNHFHYPKLPDQVKRTSVGINNDEGDQSNIHYTLFYRNESAENVFWLKIKKHTEDFVPEDSEKINLKGNHVAYYFEYPGDGGIGIFVVTIDGYDYYIEANAKLMKTKNEVLDIADSLVDKP